MHTFGYSNKTIIIFRIFTMRLLIAFAACVVYVSCSKHDQTKAYGYVEKEYQSYSKQVYRGHYSGHCGVDGFYYNDGSSFVMCSNGNSYIQPCAPGSRNSAPGNYRAGDLYSSRDFCDVNLVDYGYTLYHGYESPSYGYRDGYNSLPGYGKQEGGYGYEKKGYEQKGYEKKAYEKSTDYKPRGAGYDNDKSYGKGYTGRGYDEYSRGYDNDRYGKENRYGYGRESYGRRGDGYSKGSYAKDSYGEKGYGYGKETQSYGKDSYGKDSYGKDSYGKDSYGKDSYGKDSYGKDSYGKDSYGKDSYGYDTKAYGYGRETQGYKEESYGKSTYDKDSYGKDSYGKDSYGKASYGYDTKSYGYDNKQSYGNNKYGYDNDKPSYDDKKEGYGYYKVEYRDVKDKH